MRVEEINDYGEFLALEKDWRNLLQKSEHTVFLTWEWLSTWWKHYGKDKKLLLLLVKENNEILGIAPLMYSVYRMFGLRIGKVEFIGSPHSDYNDFILAKKKLECIKLFVNYLFNHPEKWECIDLMDIPETSKNIAFLRELSKRTEKFHKCPYIPLPKSYEEFLARLSSNQRRYIKKNLRKLEKAFEVEVTECVEPHFINEGMAWLFKLHQKRWESKGFEGAFSDEKFRSFHLDIAHIFSQKGWLGLFLLKLSGTPVAADYGFRYQSKYYAYLPGFDPKYSKYSVGNMLRAYLIRKFISEGLREFDFMRGAEEYKKRWRAVARWNYRVIIIRNGLTAKIRHWLYNQYWQQASKLKYLMKIK